MDRLQLQVALKDEQPVTEQPLKVRVPSLKVMKSLLALLDDLQLKGWSWLLCCGALVALMENQVSALGDSMSHQQP